MTGTRVRRAWAAAPLVVWFAAGLLGCQLLSGGSEYEVGSAAAPNTGGQGGGAAAGGQGGNGGQAPRPIIWAHQYGDSDDQTAWAVATDADGNIVVGGAFQGTITFGDFELTAAGPSASAFVAKLAPDATALWASAFGGDEQASDQGDVVYDIAIDETGDVYVTGLYQGTIALESPPFDAAGGYDIFVAKLSGTDGSVVWAKHYGAEHDDQGWTIAVDSAQGVAAVVGTFRDTVDFGGGHEITANGLLGQADAFALGLATGDGATLAAVGYGDEPVGVDDNDYGAGVGIDTAGDIWMAANYQGSMRVGTETHESTGETDVALIKLRIGGTVQNSLSYQGGGGDDSEVATHIEIDTGNGVLVTGWFDDSIAFGDFVLASSGAADTFVAKLDANGEATWAQNLGGGRQGNNPSVASDSAGNVVVTASCDDAIDLGAGPIICEGTDAVLTKLNGTTGSLVWGRLFGGSGTAHGRGVATDPDDNVVMVGTFDGTLELGGGESFVSAGASDAFVIKVGP